MSQVKFLLPILLILLSSCATIFSGTKDKIRIDSEPPNADVYIDGDLKGKTGQDIVLRRQIAETREVKLKKHGFVDFNFVINQKVVAIHWLGILGAGIPLMIDFVTGAAMKPKQTEFNKVLTPKEEN